MDGFGGKRRKGKYRNAYCRIGKIDKRKISKFEKEIIVIISTRKIFYFDHLKRTLSEKVKLINFNSVYYSIQVIKPIHLIIVLLPCQRSRILFSVFETVAGKLLYVLLVLEKKHQQIVEWLNFQANIFILNELDESPYIRVFFQNSWGKSTIVRYCLQNKLKKIFCNWIIFFNYVFLFCLFFNPVHLVY
jgi:hypothetical protein